MKITVKAPANIAFIKFWGKKDEVLRLPMNDSISMNLSGASTTTSVEFSKEYGSDTIKIDGKVAIGKEKERVVKHLDLLRNLAGTSNKAKVESHNNFPKGTGIASSASGFAALTLAGTKALGLDLNIKKLSILARMGSGSACRSIPDGFALWRKGTDSDSSYAQSIYPPEYWDIRDIVALVGETSKKVSSTEGHARVESSPFYNARILDMKRKVQALKNAFKTKDFKKFGEIIEEEAINMHTVMMTSNPPLFYWTPKTLEIMQAVRDWRDKGLQSYFTIDAGPNIHIICLGKDAMRIRNKLQKIGGLKDVIINKPAQGARVIN